jgi:hypothetical protein
MEEHWSLHYRNSCIGYWYGGDMKIKTPSDAYLLKAKALSEGEAERVLSRISGKLRRRHDRDKIFNLEAIAIQLELEDEQLEEWREKMAMIRKKGKA